MSCPPTDDLASYIDGELPLNRHRELEEHARSCARCGAELDELRRIVARVAPQPGEWDDVDLLADVDAAIAAEEQAGEQPQARPAPRQRRRRWVRYAVIAAPTGTAAQEKKRTKNAIARRSGIT